MEKSVNVTALYAGVVSAATLSTTQTSGDKMSNIRSDGKPSFTIIIDDREDRIQWHYKPMRAGDIRAHSLYQNLIEEGIDVKEQLTVDYKQGEPEAELSIIFYKTHYTEKQMQYCDYLQKLDFSDELHYINTKSNEFFLLGSKKTRKLQKGMSLKEIGDELFQYEYDVRGQMDAKSIDERINELINAVVERSRRIFDEAVRLAERVEKKIAEDEIKKKEKKAKVVK